MPDIVINYEIIFIIIPTRSRTESKSIKCCIWIQIREETTLLIEKRDLMNKVGSQEVGFFLIH